MAQITSGIRAVLSMPSVYSSFQRFLGADNTWRVIAQQLLPLRAGVRLLDVGCGPCDILNWLPANVDYVGVDLNEQYVRSARERFGARGQFIAGDAAALPLQDTAPFDVALAVGLLHHLDDAQATSLFQSLRSLLKPDGCIVVVEPCFHDGQSALERFLMRRDRGQNVRNESGYRRLVPPSFSNVQTRLVGNVTRIPWSLLAVTAS